MSSVGADGKRPTTRVRVPLPQVPLHSENVDQAAQLPFTGHGCDELHDVMLMGDPTQ